MSDSKSPHAGDRIATGPKTRVKFRLTDGTLVTLGDNTEFTLVAYGYDAKAQTGRAVLELAKGFFRTVTGAIAKLKKPEFEVKTPVATLGIRGTDFWGELTAQGLRVALISGRVVTVTNRAGSVEIAQPGWGTTVTAADTAPLEPFKWSDAALNKAMGTVD